MPTQQENGNEPIKVSCAWEQHDYIAQQRCACGGELRWIRATLDERGAGVLQELMHTECVRCDAEHTFRFDVTEAALSGGSLRWMEDAMRAWPPPTEGPYAVRMDAYAAAMAELFPDGGQQRLPTREQYEEALSRSHPVIGGVYRVFGHRRGSMGTAYLCRHLATGESVVVKAIDSRSYDEEAGAALRREAATWLRVGWHPNVVGLRDVLALSPDSIALVMDWVSPGPKGSATLREWIESGRLGRLDALEFARQVAAALAHCSRCLPGFVHGDLKPENVLVEMGRIAKITDLGLARSTLLPAMAANASRPPSTPLYLAPECWRSGELTQQSDVYAFGVALFEMLTGRNPLERVPIDDLASTDAALGMGPTDDPLLRIAAQCAQADPAGRPASFREVLHLLGAEAVGDDREGSAVVINNRMTALVAIGEHEEAIALQLEVVSRAPEHSVAWTNLGVAYRKAGRVREALDAHMRALELAPDSAQVHANIAAVFFTGGRPDIALTYAARAVELDPGYFGGQLNRVTALNALNRPAEAAAAAEAARARCGDHPMLSYERGLAYLRLGKWGRARTCADQALKLDPQFELAQQLRAATFARGRAPS